MFKCIGTKMGNLFLEMCNCICLLCSQVKFAPVVAPLERWRLDLPIWVMLQSRALFSSTPATPAVRSSVSQVR